jgi:hypothetical protein
LIKVTFLFTFGNYQNNVYGVYILKVKIGTVLFFPIWKTHKKINHLTQYDKKYNPQKNKSIKYFTSYQELQEYVREKRENFLEE